MHVITWILKHIIPTAEGGNVALDMAYFAYVEDSAAKGSDAVTVNVFSRTMTNVFEKGEINRKRRGNGQNRTSFAGVELVLSNDDEHIQFDSVKDAINQSGVKSYVTETTSTLITCHIPTTVTMNNIPIIKIVKFYADLEWELYVGTVKVDLENLGVDSKFELKQIGVRLVLSIADKVRLCFGKEKVGGDTIVRSICVEVLNNSKTDTQMVVLRSRACSRVVTFYNQECTTQCKPCYDIFENTRKLNKPKELVLNDTKPNELDKFIEVLLPGAPPAMVSFIKEQRRMLKRKKATAYRWSTEILGIWLRLRSNCPRAYRELKATRMFIMPSAASLKLYSDAANKPKRMACLDPKVLEWMRQEADKRDVPKEGREGGLFLHQMTLEEDIALTPSGDLVKGEGYVDVWEEGDDLHIICAQTADGQTADHILLFVFLGHGGFRFPFTHCPRQRATANDLHSQVWESVSTLQSYGFYVEYVNLDRAATSHTFMHALCNTTPPSSDNFRATCPVDPTKTIVVIMDIKHSLRKLRDSILTSGLKGTRLLMVHGHQVTWRQWRGAYDFDRQNPTPTNRKLSQHHLTMDGVSEMQNLLAEEALNGEMHQLMVEFQEDSGIELQGAIELLLYSSALVAAFTYDCPISTFSDPRLQQLRSANAWFKGWAKEVNSDNSLSPAEKERRLPSPETMEALESGIVGFLEMCQDRLSRSPRAPINPARVNSNMIEMAFCQQHGIGEGSASNAMLAQFSTEISVAALGVQKKPKRPRKRLLDPDVNRNRQLVRARKMQRAAPKAKGSLNGKGPPQPGT